MEPAQPASIQEKILLATTSIIILSGVGFFSFLYLNTPISAHINIPNQATQPVTSISVVTNGDGASMSISPPPISTQTPEQPVAVASELKYRQEITALFPGATLSAGEKTDSIFASLVVTNFLTQRYTLLLPTGEQVDIYDIQKKNPMEKSILSALLETAGERTNTGAVVSPTTMSQKSAFYYNRLDKPQNVGIVIEQKNGEVYAFDYPSGYHQTFKTFFQTL